MTLQDVFLGLYKYIQHNIYVTGNILIHYYDMAWIKKEGIKKQKNENDDFWFSTIHFVISYQTQLPWLIASLSLLVVWFNWFIKKIFLQDAHFFHSLTNTDVDGVVRHVHWVFELVDTVKVVVAVETVLIGKYLVNKTGKV